MMKNSTKILIVIGGYVLACIAAYAISWVNELFTPADAKASQGMFAFGQSILFMIVFGGLALIPTVLAFFFLRSSQKFWNGFAIFCLLFSVMGSAIIVLNALINASILHIEEATSAVISLFGVLGVFAAPIFILGFLILAVIAPSRLSRVLLVTSAGLEILGGLYVAWTFIFLQRFF